MNQQKTPPPEEAALDLGLLCRMLLQKWKTIVLCTVASCILCLGLTVVFARPKYQSSMILYVSNVQGVENLENSIVVVLKMRQTLMEVLHTADNPRNHIQLEKMIRAAALQQTHFFQVVVTSPDPHEAKQLAEAIGEVLPRRLSEILGGIQTMVADEPVLETVPSSPNYSSSGLLGALVGLSAVLGWVLLQTLLADAKRFRQ